MPTLEILKICSVFKVTTVTAWTSGLVSPDWCYCANYLDPVKPMIWSRECDRSCPILMWRTNQIIRWMRMQYLFARHFCAVSIGRRRSLFEITPLESPSRDDDDGKGSTWRSTSVDGSKRDVDDEAYFDRKRYLFSSQNVRTLLILPLLAGVTEISWRKRAS